MTLADRIVTELKADATIVSTFASRVFPEDIRAAGPDVVTVPVRDAEGYRLPALCVDVQDGYRQIGAPSGAMNTRIGIVAIAEAGFAGRMAIEGGMESVVRVLHRWQDPETLSLLQINGHTGYRPDPPPDTGAIGTVTFVAAGIAKGVRT